MADLKEAAGEAGFRLEEARRYGVREGVTALEAWTFEVDCLDCRVGVFCLSPYGRVEDGDLAILWGGEDCAGVFDVGSALFMGEEGGRGVAVAAGSTPRVVLLVHEGSGGVGGSSPSMEGYAMSGSILEWFQHCRIYYAIVCRQVFFIKES